MSARPKLKPITHEDFLGFALDRAQHARLKSDKAPKYSPEWHALRRQYDDALEAARYHYSCIPAGHELAPDVQQLMRNEGL